MKLKRDNVYGPNTKTHRVCLFWCINGNQRRNRKCESPTIRWPAYLRWSREDTGDGQNTRVQAEVPQITYTTANKFVWIQWDWDEAGHGNKQDILNRVEYFHTSGIHLGNRRISWGQNDRCQANLQKGRFYFKKYPGTSPLTDRIGVNTRSWEKTHDSFPLSPTMKCTA